MSVLVNQVRHIRRTVDSLQSVELRMEDSQQALNDKVDSLSSAINEQLSAQMHHASQMNSLIAKVDAVKEYGMGFSDSTSTISIPLIIALLAFAFPFLFTVITHINSKYNSEYISKMFAEDKAYRAFMWMSGISAGYLILMGGLSLLLEGDAHLAFMPILDYTSILLAGEYSGIIIWFVMTCIKYNDPQQMYGVIQKRYQAEMKSAQKFVENQEKKERKNEKEKSRGRKHFRELGFRMNKVYAPYNAEFYRTSRLTDLCKFAIERGNANLFYSVFYKMKDDMVDNKDSRTQLFYFYENIVDEITEAAHDEKLEDTLMYSWLQTFDRKEVPNLGFVYRMLGKMMKAVELGKYGIFEKYIHHAQYGYAFINHTGNVNYVTGATPAKQEEVNKEQLETWLELHEMHYIVTAHLFANGHVRILNTLNNNRRNRYSGLYPKTASEILRMYASCKEHQDKFTGSLSHNISIDKVIGENYDRELLEKFTAVLLLNAFPQDKEHHALISEKKLQIILDKQGELIRYGDIWKKDSELCRLYPQITERTIKDIIKEGIDGFGYQDGKEIDGAIYNVPMTTTMAVGVRDIYRNILYGNLQNILDGMQGNATEDKTEQINMGIYAHLTGKQGLLTPEGIAQSGMFQDKMQLFKNRYLYILYEAISGMSIRETTRRWEDFEEFFEMYTGGKGDEFVIIDTDSEMDMLLPMDDLPDGQRWNVRRTFKGAYYKAVDIDTSLYLKNIPIIEDYRDTLLVIRVADLPVPISMSGDDMPEVDLVDMSDRNKGIAAVMVKMDPKLAFKYSKEAVVMKVRIVK